MDFALPLAPKSGVSMFELVPGKVAPFARKVIAILQSK